MKTVNEILLFIGGITVFLLGLTGISRSASNLAAEKTRRILGKCSSNPIKGIMTGAAVTAVAQSSIAINVAAIGFVDSGMLSFYSAAAIIMGANIGTTVTAQIVSFSGATALDITALGCYIRINELVIIFIDKFCLLGVLIFCSFDSFSSEFFKSHRLSFSDNLLNFGKVRIVFVAAVAEIFFGAGGRNDGLADRIVYDLCLDVVIGAINAESGAFGGAEDLSSDSFMSLETFCVTVFSVYHSSSLLPIIYRSYRLCVLWSR